MRQNKYLIVSGGTGGHVIPAVNFGNYLIDQGYSCYFITDKRGKKYTSSFKGKIKIIHSSHLSNSFFNKIYAIFLIIIGFFQSIIFIFALRPYACISFGSYASFAPLLILSLFRLLGITKIYLHEQNSVMGRANVLSAFFANKIFLNYERTIRLKKNFKGKSLFVGFPSNYTFKYKKKRTDLNDKRVKKLFICGGSQGAVSMNRIILDLLCKMPKNILNQLQISIQCPEMQEKEVRKILNKLSVNYDLKNFYNEFVEKLNKTDLLITRSGAGTVNDVILSNTPTIFVPLPSSANNHQYYNANFLLKQKAALLIEQKNLNTKESLLQIINLLTNLNQQIKLINNLQKIKIFDTNKIIFENIK